MESSNVSMEPSTPPISSKTGKEVSLNVKGKEEAVRSSIGLGNSSTPPAETQRILSNSLKVITEGRKIIVRFENGPQLVYFERSPNVGEISDASTAMLNAALQGNLEAVRTLKEVGVQVDPAINAQDSSLFTPLMRAIGKGQVEIVQALLEAGADIHMKNRKGDTALMFAVFAVTFTKNVEIMKALLNAYKPSDHHAALMFAIKEGNVEAVRLLIEAGVKMDETAPLICEAITGKKRQVEMVRTLLEANINIHVPDASEFTPLMRVVAHPQLQENDRLEILQALIKAGAYKQDYDETNPHKTQTHIITALTLAARRGQAQVVQALLNAQQENFQHYRTPDWLTNPQPELWRKMQAYARENHTALINAIRFGHNDVVKEILKIYPSVDTDHSAFSIAALCCNMKIVQEFLNTHTVDMDDARNEDGSTVLACEIMRHGAETELAKKWIELGADKEYAEEIIRRKWLAHVWGIGGLTSVKDKNGVEHLVRLDTIYRRYALNELSNNVVEFTESNELIKQSISKEDRETIKRCVKNAIDCGENNNSEEILERIKSGNPIMILGGSVNHVVSILICKDELIVFNRGLGRQANTAERYSLPKEDCTNELIEKLTREYPDYESFGSMIENLNLISKGGFTQKDQKIENCSWASSKGAFGVLCRAYADPNWSTQDDSINKAKDNKGYEIYKQFTSFVREKVYMESQSILDKDLLQQVNDKRLRKFGV